MRVLVTRPKANGEKTAKRLEALGHEALLLPLFEPVHDVAAVRAAFGRQASALAVTSAEAIRAILAAGPMPPAFRDLPVLAVGGKTAAAAKAAGFSSVEAAGGTGSDLADLVASKATALRGGILYLAGEPRASFLENRLADAGITLSTQVVYRMLPLDIAPESLQSVLNARFDVILFFSAETAHRFFELTGIMAAVEANGARILCLSHEVAKNVPRQFDRLVEVAEMPSEASLLELL